MVLDDLDSENFIERLVDNQIYSVNYDKYIDMLVVYVINPELSETIVRYLDEFVGLIYTSNNMNVVGFQIEGFKVGFLSTIILEKLNGISALLHYKN